MNRHKYILLLLFMLAASLQVAAQGLVVKNFYHAERDFTANSGRNLIKDQNDEPCALIKVRTMQKGLTFDAGRLFPIEKTEEQGGDHPLDIYVWVQNGAKRFSIGHPQLGVLSEYDLQTTLLPGQTYILELVTGEVQTIVKQARTTQYVVFQLTPPEAVVELNGEMLASSGGTAQKLMPFGSYQYTVKAPNYQMEVGRIKVDDPKNKHIVTVSLKPNFAAITLTAPSGAEIWVDEELKGTGSWTGNLGAGAHIFEARLAGHHPSQRNYDLVVADGPQTITLEAPTPIVGEAEITSDPALADIYIDGKKVGQTPQLVSDLLVGSHSIKLSRSGYADYTGTLSVKEGEKTSCTASLTKLSSAEELFQKGKTLYGQKNYQEAIVWIRKAADLGHPDAQYYLGLCYNSGDGVTIDYSESVKWFRKAAEQGNTNAQYMLGTLYDIGYGVTQDFNEAAKWYRKAAEQGNTNALYSLGWCYYYGHGVTQKYKEAVIWLRKASEQGNADAQYYLGLCYEKGQGVTKDYAEAVKWYRKAAEQDDVSAQYNLGVCYYDGKGVTKDYTEAVKWYRKAAEQGHEAAQYNLGVCYYDGKGVTKDYAEAVKWYRKAAEHGQPSAQSKLGDCYENGYGVTKDSNEAAKWYRKAAEQGDADAQCNLGWFYFIGHGVTKDYYESFKWYRKAAEQGDKGAQYNLGNYYYYGWGVKQNKKEAKRWLQKAADQGNQQAKEDLKNSSF